MSPPAIIAYLARRGFSIGLADDGEHLTIDPAPTDELLVDRIRAVKPELVAYLRDAAHAFVVLASSSRAIVAECGVCLACGVPWRMHGEPPLETWLAVVDADAAVLRDAAAIVANAWATAQGEARPSESDRGSRNGQKTRWP